MLVSECISKYQNSAIVTKVAFSFLDIFRKDANNALFVLIHIVFLKTELIGAKPIVCPNECTSTLRWVDKEDSYNYA